MAAKYPHVNLAVRSTATERGMKASDVAEALGVAPSTVYRWFGGEDSPNPAIWPQLEALLDISLDALHEVSWQAEMAEMRAHVARLEDRVAALEADRPAPRLRAAQGPAGAHRSATTRPARRPNPPAADPDDHTI
jgi:AcrR family transcriptional regulator